ncbi:MAG: family 16 glycoside hydrolase [Verrucomicrobiota bacterium]
MKTLQSLGFGLALTLSGAACFGAEAGFTSLFNGKDLTGWRGNPALWSVQDGAITGKTPADPANPGRSTLKHNTFLVYTNGEVADFELRLSYRIVAGNSGIQYRSKVLQEGEFGPIVGGYQADFEAGKTYSGILYEERGRGILAQRGQKTTVKPEIEIEQKGKKAKKADVQVTGSVGKSEDIQANIKHEDWNDYVVIARGNHLQHFINGMPTVDVVDEDAAKAAKSGILALQIHQGPPMTVQFKNVRIKKLSGGSAKADLEAIQGAWTPTQLIGNGEAAAEETLSAIKLDVKGNSYFVRSGDDEDGGTFEVLDGSTPRHMNVTTRKGDFVPAIYELSGDTMRVCYAVNGAARPTEFKSAEGTDHVLAVYKRVQ